MENYLNLLDKYGLPRALFDFTAARVELLPAIIPPASVTPGELQPLETATSAAPVTFAQLISASYAIQSGVPGEATARETTKEDCSTCAENWCCVNSFNPEAPCPVGAIPRYVPPVSNSPLPWGYEKQPLPAFLTNTNGAEAERGESAPCFDEVQDYAAGDQYAEDEPEVANHES
jgi:hypothetical protein